MSLRKMASNNATTHKDVVDESESKVVLKFCLEFQCQSPQEILYQPKTGGELLRLHEGVSSRVPHLQSQMPAVDYIFWEVETRRM